MPTTRTIDHDEIREWAESHGGSPAVLAQSRVGESGMLRLDFGEGVEELERISWDDFFDIFDSNELAFVYESDEAAGDASVHYHFESRTAEDEYAAMNAEEEGGITDMEGL